MTIFYSVFFILEKLHLSKMVLSLLITLILILLTACNNLPQYNNSLGGKNFSISSAIYANPNIRRKGGYYLDDGPGESLPPNLHLIPDAVPKVEPIRSANKQPYIALGKYFIPMTELRPYKERGVASWYGRRYHGNTTALGEIYDMYAMTAAHPTLPLPSYAKVTNLENGKSIIVRLNDRGPFLSDRLIDLSYTAAYKLGVLAKGSSQIEVESILPVSNIHSKKLATTGPADTKKLPADVKVSKVNAIYLQLGAFGLSDNAHSFLIQVRNKIPWFSNSLHISKNNNLYKIHAGPYPDQILAQQAANTINQHLEIRPIMIIDQAIKKIPIASNRD